MTGERVHESSWLCICITVKTVKRNYFSTLFIVFYALFENTPYLAHVKANPNCKSRYGIVLSGHPRCQNSRIIRAVKSERKQQWEKVARKVANDIQESRKPFEDAIPEKQNRLQLLQNKCSAFSDNKIIYLKNLPFESYNIMAMREAQTQFGEKYIMLLVPGQNETLGLCYSNKEIERYMRENLTNKEKEKIRDPKRNYVTLFGKPLAVLNITGWGRTPQRHVVVYCNLTLAEEMEKDSIKSLWEQIREKYNKLKMPCADSTISMESPSLLAREEMVP